MCFVDFSAITQQVQGLATDTSPGLVSTTTQTFAGAKTFQDGAAIKGATAAPAAGYVGEVATPTYGSSSSISNGTTNTQYASVLLSPGVWKLSGSAQISTGGTTAPAGWTTFLAYIQSTVAGPSTDRYSSGFDSGNAFTFIPANSNYAMSIPERIVTVASATTYYLVVRMGMTTTNSALHRPDLSSLIAVRIA